MEWVVYLIAVFIIILVVFVNGAIQERKQYKRFLVSLNENFGKRRDKTEPHTDIQKIADYHKKMMTCEKDVSFLEKIPGYVSDR